MLYSLFQIKVNPDALDLNEPSIKAQLEATIKGDPTLGLQGNLYVKVAEIEATDLDNVFEIGNIGPEDHITRIGKMHSVSVGDIIEGPDGQRVVVASFGFDPVNN